MRATIIASVDAAGEAQAAEAWLEAAKDRLTHVSGQLGCGCCVVSWDVEGPAELIATLPDDLRAHGEWDPMPKQPGVLARLCRALRPSRAARAGPSSGGNPG
ncbi:hypothetical protein EJV46_03935 [Roseococcus sp. SYP-B2431]|uniref:hypothetical protein n=1 Tax=Roseococcus sp. SYP-B2431 TaxID=2496640 RepID=UPI00103A6BA8|nr:hypothetical protein [Roseococcus sp. SYP-B2431]TCH99828.1 hypothetical protein EJV46_03935 [Roseococcus sp. SYP-B2431]